jgi:hypothetical protein
MNDIAQRVRELMDEAGGLEYGTTRAALLEEAVRLADLSGDVSLGFEVRQDYMDAANFAGQVDQMMVAFSWCLAQADRDPEKFPQFGLLWKFKWVLSHLPEFPQVPWSQIDSVLADMTRRYEQAGSTGRALQTRHRALAMHRGDRVAASRAHRALLATPRDRLSDCAACEMDSIVDYLFFLGRDDQTVAEAAPILAGRYRCAEVPHRTYARVLLPLLRLGRVEEAMHNHVRGYRMIARNPGFVYAFGYHIDFLTLTDNLPRAVKLFEKHLADALVCPARTWRMDFYLAAGLLVERLLEQGHTERKLRLPATFALHRPDNHYPLADLLAWFRAQSNDMAQQFDARNGNDYSTRKVNDHPGLKALVHPHPLPVGDGGEGKNSREKG